MVFRLPSANNLRTRKLGTAGKKHVIHMFETLSLGELRNKGLHLMMKKQLFTSSGAYLNEVLKVMTQN
jgi:hypothetical protein